MIPMPLTIATQFNFNCVGLVNMLLYVTEFSNGCAWL